MLERPAAPALVRVHDAPSPADVDAICAADPLSMPSQTAEWSRAISADGYRTLTRVYEFSDGVRAMMPLFRSRRIPAALATVQSPPDAWGFGGIASTGPLRSGHVEAILKECASMRHGVIRIRPNPLLDEVWSAGAEAAGWQAIPRNAFVLDLEGGLDTVWKSRFPSGTRTKIRKAEKCGVVVETASDDRLLDDFYALLEMSFARWGANQREPEALARLRGRLRDPKAKFRTMIREAGSTVRFFVARLDGRPLAAALVLYGREAHYTRGAMDRDAIGPTFANYLIHAKAIEAACEAGCSHYHMGETAPGSSLAQFKAGFGAGPVPYHEYVHERLPLLTADRMARTLVKRAIGFRDA